MAVFSEQRQTNLERVWHRHQQTFLRSRSYREAMSRVVQCMRSFSQANPEAKKNGTPASPATALASNVFPVPGEPVSRIPLGSLPPSVVKVVGSLRKSTTSCSS